MFNNLFGKKCLLGDNEENCGRAEQATNDNITLYMLDN
jgi:hypothetical protein